MSQSEFDLENLSNLINNLNKVLLPTVETCLQIQY
ncbi:hypothetical protein SAMN04490178_10583 [Propionispora vibrioides]|uniref:Uncharacterized protein n=1 Tax=Propionispora vibrioides TaxID=112903 RepID=A0A1H8SJZ9_9FIRM|nr:hypothetical protein SAMN04490178_10583 [Propionispora vibrioides]